jgi:hypothetical protein
MQMLCKVSTAFSDVQCPICAEGFAVYWTRKNTISREQQCHNLQQALRDQHTGPETTSVHAPAFHLPEHPVAVQQRRPRPALATAIPLYS